MDFIDAALNNRISNLKFSWFIKLVNGIRIYPEYKITISEPGSNILLIGKFDIEIDESKIYVHTPCDADSGFNFINKNVVKVEREGNKLYVYAKVAFGIYDFALVEYFDDYTRDNRIEAKEVEDYPDVDIDKIPANWDSYKTYKYSFNIVGSKYYINKIELSK